MAIKVRTDRPFGLVKGAPSQHLNLEGQSEVLVDQSLELHATMAKRWAKKLEALTGIRMAKRPGGYRGSPFTRDELAMRVKAGGESGGQPGWQEKGGDAEKELGGQFFPETEDEMGKFAERIGLDLSQVKTALAARGARLLMPGNTDIDPSGVAEGRRTAMNNSTNSQALAIDYLADFQFQLSNAGQLEECFGQHVDLPNGKATLNIKKLGYGQMILQGPVTTESFSVVTPVEPTTDEKTFTPFKLMMSMWATGEFDEDCFAPWLPAMEQAARLGRAITLDHIRLRGHSDTAAGANINAYGGALALGANDPRGAVNGFYGANWDGTIGGGSADAMKGVGMAGAAANLNLVPALRAALNKYGLQSQTPNLRLIGGARTRAQFVQDAKARPDTYSLLLRKEGGVYYLDDVKYIELADSVVTNASSGGIPTYALWNSEGNPINLNAGGAYDATTTDQTALVLVNIANWIHIQKRMFNWLVVRLPLADQVAVVGSERLTFGPVHDSVSEVVAYNLSR